MVQLNYPNPMSVNIPGPAPWSIGATKGKSSTGDYIKTIMDGLLKGIQEKKDNEVKQATLALAEKKQTFDQQKMLMDMSTKFQDMVGDVIERGRELPDKDKPGYIDAWIEMYKGNPMSKLFWPTILDDREKMLSLLASKKEKEKDTADWTEPKSAQDESGKEVMVQTNKRTGEVRLVEGFAPIKEKGKEAKAPTRTTFETTIDGKPYKITQEWDQSANTWREVGRVEAKESKTDYSELYAYARLIDELQSAMKAENSDAVRMILERMRKEFPDMDVPEIGEEENTEGLFGRIRSFLFGKKKEESTSQNSVTTPVPKEEKDLGTMLKVDEKTLNEAKALAKRTNKPYKILDETTGKFVVVYPDGSVKEK